LSFKANTNQTIKIQNPTDTKHQLIIDQNGKQLATNGDIDIMTRDPVGLKQDVEINEIIDIILQKAIILIPVVDHEHKLIGVVGRLDILQHNLNEKFVPSMVFLYSK